MFQGPCLLYYCEQTSVHECEHFSEVQEYVCNYSVVVIVTYYGLDN
jgi:hypothetical protein